MLTRDNAVARLLEALPEYQPAWDEITDLQGELLLHVMMGDLARFYMREYKQRDVRERFWRVVEELAADGDQYVENAVHVSLIEWFAWGSPEEVRAMDDARELHGPATRAIRAHYAS
jgi:hypothetical protein